MPPPKQKQAVAKVKLQIPGGQATPAPPVGPALGQHGVNIGEFVQKFNEQTRQQQGTIIPVEITIYGDRKFDFILKSPPAAVLVKQAVGIAKGATLAARETVGTIRRSQLEDIAKQKMNDLNAADLEGAVRMIEGTCRSMGVKVDG
jgi:large subunit ribosomal protein L11